MKRLFFVTLTLLALNACYSDQKEYAISGVYSRETSEEPAMPCSTESLLEYREDVRDLSWSTLILGAKESDAVVGIAERNIRLLGFDRHIEEYVNYSIYQGSRSQRKRNDISGITTKTSVFTTATVCFKKNLIAIERVTETLVYNGSASKQEQEADRYMYLLAEEEPKKQSFL